MIGLLFLLTSKHNADFRVGICPCSWQLLCFGEWDAISDNGAIRLIADR